MNLNHLKYFYVVAKEGGFTKASQALRIQQPAISRMVAQLEEHFGFALFERMGRQVQLTPQGREVYEKARNIFEAVENLERSVGNISGECQGLLALGGSEPLASHFIPRVLGDLLPLYPKLYPAVHSGPSSGMLELIEKGELEFGLFFHIPRLSSKLKMSVLKKIRFHLVVRKDCRRQTSVLESFIGSREIDDTSTRSFPTLDKLKKIHPKAKIRISSNNLTSHHAMVSQGLGVAVLPDFLVSQDLKQGIFVDVLPEENLEFSLKIVERETVSRSLNAQVFLNTCLRLS